MKLNLGKLIGSSSVLLAFVIICVIMGVLTPTFFTVDNIRLVILHACINAVLAVGLTFVIITAGIDLSVGSVLAFCGIMLGISIRSGVPLPLALVICIAVGVACGLTNGFIITRMKLPPFIATLGMMSIARGAALVVSDGKPISSFSDSFLFIANGTIVGIPVMILITAVVYILAHLTLTRTPFGRHVYATGGNQEAARLSGVDTGKVLLWVYMISGLLCGLAAIMFTARVNSAGPTAGLMYELFAIAAAVIGGTSLMGGFGNVWGTLIGALIISVINNGLNLLNVSSYIQQIVIGTVIILAVFVDALKERSKGKSSFGDLVRKHVAASVIIIVALVAGLSVVAVKMHSASKTKSLILIVKTLNNPFFVDMERGAQEEVRKYPGYDLVVQGPDMETDVERQLQIMENAIQKKVAAITVAPCGSKEVITSIKKANEAGIPVLTIDVRADEKLMAEKKARVETYIGSDNYTGGKLAGKFIAEKLKGRGNIIILEGIAGHENVENRRKGCADFLKNYPGIKIVASQTANAERGKGFEVTMNLLQAYPDVNAIFGVNDEMAMGALEAVKQSGKLGKIIVVGFDASDDAKAAMRKGELAGSISQYPQVMGREAVDSMIKVIEGQKIPEEIPTKVELVTQETLAAKAPVK